MAKQRMLLQTGRCLMLASVLLCMAPRCFAEYMTLKVVHEGDGTPVSEQYITMQLQYENSGEQRQISQRTDSAGEARFRVPLRRPDSVRIEVHFNERGFRCSCRVQTEPETVFRTGLVIAPRTRKSENSSLIEARPGQIVFVARPSSLLQKILFDDH